MRKETYKYGLLILFALLFQITHAQEETDITNNQWYIFWEMDTTTNEFIDIDGESAWEFILRECKGKPAYVNLCGTWCKGCIESFYYVKAHREKFEKHGLTYIYIWYSSDRRQQKDLVEEHQLEGKHFTITSDEQLKYIQNKINNEGFPAYFLLDKEGNIFKKVAAFPSNPESFEQIEELLEL